MNMHVLAELQADFTGRIFDPTTEIPLSLANHTQGPNNHQRFTVYRNNVIASLIEAMGDNFPSIKRLVGDEYFTAVAKLWISENPPKQPMLFQYGAGFASFLDNFEPLKGLPYLGDIARLEQARREAYYARDAEILSLNVFRDISEDDLANCYLHLHPSARLIRSDYPIQVLWAYNAGEETSSELDLQNCPPENLFITRPRFDVHHHPVITADAVFITALVQRKPLGEAANLANTCSDFELASVLGLLFQSGGVSEITLT